MDGFESLVDGVLLLTVLLAATGVVQSLATPRGDPNLPATYAEDFRRALLRSTLDGLRYLDGGAHVDLANGTSVEALLRLEVHVLSRTRADFGEANARIEALGAALVRPGWSLAVTGGPPGREDLVRIGGGEVPTAHLRSSWAYPSLDGGPDVTLSVVLWLSPPR